MYWIVFSYCCRMERFIWVWSGFSWFTNTNKKSYVHTCNSMPSVLAILTLKLTVFGRTCLFPLPLCCLCFVLILCYFFVFVFLFCLWMWSLVAWHVGVCCQSRVKASYWAAGSSSSGLPCRWTDAFTVFLCVLIGLM